MIHKEKGQTMLFCAKNTKEFRIGVFSAKICFGTAEFINCEAIDLKNNLRTISEPKQSRIPEVIV